MLALGLIGPPTPRTAQVRNGSATVTSWVIVRSTAPIRRDRLVKIIGDVLLHHHVCDFDLTLDQPQHTRHLHLLGGS